MRTGLWLNGGRGSARRSLLVALLSMCAAAPPTAALRAVPDVPPQVTVREERGVYTVAARFAVAQPISIAFDVLTDYEAIPRFMPDVKTSIVRQVLPDGAIVEQEAVARLMMFSKRVHLLLDVRVHHDAVTFRDSSRRSFSRYEGAWRLTRQDGLTVVTYELTARPSFDVPEFLLTRLLRRDAHRMIERLRAEIAARSGQDLTH